MNYSVTFKNYDSKFLPKRALQEDKEQREHSDLNRSEIIIICWSLFKKTTLLATTNLKGDMQVQNTSLPLFRAILKAFVKSLCVTDFNSI